MPPLKKLFRSTQENLILFSDNKKFANKSKDLYCHVSTKFFSGLATTLVKLVNFILLNTSMKVFTKLELTVL